MAMVQLLVLALALSPSALSFSPQPLSPSALIPSSLNPSARLRLPLSPFTPRTLSPSLKTLSPLALSMVGLRPKQTSSRVLSDSDPNPQVLLYDTTLRDGAQGEGIALSCDDKLRIASRLHRFGAHYIEGGWPGSNPKDAEFFKRAKVELPPEAWDKVAAFGSTRYKNIKVEEDKQVKMLVESEARVITLVGKSWDLHVDEVLETTRQENLDMIKDTVSYLKSLGKEIMLDAEHFYDGFRANEEYAMECLNAAVEGDVDWLVLCDTNGGTLPWDIRDITNKVAARFPGTKLGIHCHNDQGMAVANSLAAVLGGASVIQGTVNGFGERTGNANLISILPTLSGIMERSALGNEDLGGLTALSRYVDEQANQPNNGRSAFVGSTQTGKRPCFPGAQPRDFSRRRIGPEVVGNGLGGLGTTQGKGVVNPQLLDSLRKYATDEEVNDAADFVMKTVKRLEERGSFVEGADASVDLMLRRSLANYKAPFEIIDYNVHVYDDGPDQYNDQGTAQATVKLRVGQEVVDRYVIKELRKLGDLAADAANLANLASMMGHDRKGTELLEVAEGNGPVNALGKALVKALLPLFPSLEAVELRDYKVRILDNEMATAAIPRVIIEFEDRQLLRRWTTASSDPNIISASFNALVDGVEYFLEHRTLTQNDDTL